MGFQYQLIKTILIGIFWQLDGLIPEAWIFLILGAFLPPLNLVIARDKYMVQFPWELYLFYAYSFYGIFYPVDTHLVFLGVGYALSRLAMYYKLKGIINT
ncbi:hypothetical protein [Colwellia sp. UCD-KL20]|uniref:hypothetical protein n=1 Tax=Colwellia sp. UCD-KL20 TaxID=1917165 RepID=UPI0009710308|nr:hypothetical protein [Colwellia sp. UCD-KL20]